MAIRFATINDHKQICALLSQLGGYDDTEAFMAEKLRAILDRPDHYLLVDENHETLQGLAALVIVNELGLNGNTALITYIVVQANCRSTGIGEKLEQECCRIAKERNCIRIQLHCAATRTKAHKFYEKQGYNESPKYFSKGI